VNIPQLTSEARLASDLVQVWRVHLARTQDDLRALGELLSPDERERAASFHFEVHRHRFVVARGCLRQVLSAQLNLKPRDVAFRYARYGKPELADSPRELPVKFNLSHSDDEALIAVTLGSRVGADLERIRPLDDLAGLARACFSTGECDVLMRLDAEARTQAFFLAWTRKEAFLKALGTGFSLAPTEFDVSLLPGEPAQLLSVPAGVSSPAVWSLIDLPMADGVAGAVAVEAPNARVEMHDFGT